VNEMCLHPRLLPGAKIWFTRRGARREPGPQAARLHPRAGGRGAPAGTGPFTGYRPLRRRQQ
jgi:hypothetical protein